MGKGNIHIKLYGNGQFMGYVKRISTYYGKVDSTPSIENAKSYSKAETAATEGELIRAITHGALNYEVV